MSLDSGYLKSVTAELNKALRGCKVDKVNQLDRDNLVLSFRGYQVSSRVMMSANANNARLHLTNRQYENPAQPPMFCMLLRKHLVGAKLVEITQPNFERIAEFCFEGYDELGESRREYLAVEIMGRHSNIIFFDAERRIIDSMKHVDMTMSMARQVLPGLLYEYPPAQNKIDPLAVGKEELPELMARFDEEKRLDKEILNTFTGLSPIICREVCFRATGVTDPCLKDFSELQRDKLAFYLWDMIHTLQTDAFSCTMLYEKETERPKEFAFWEIRQYGDTLAQRGYQSPSALLDDYYELRDRSERMRQKSQDVFKTVMSAMERVGKKITLQKTELEESGKREIYKIYGDLIMANIYKMERGMEQVEVENFYDENKLLSIPLDNRNTPSQNAQMYYRRYQKMKAAEEHLTRYISENEEELRYLETVFDNIYKAENEKELNEMRTELKEQGYILRRSKQVSNKKTVPSKPMHFQTEDGFSVYVGKNNKQNDELTLRTADRWDLWLHTKNAPGSHTILETEGAALDDLPVRAITQAAVLAATYSSVKEGKNVPVDYALVRNVKKPSGAKPGMVIYDHFYTAYVTPDLLLAERLRVDKQKKERS